MVPSEEPCHFPFRYHGEMHYSCIPGSFSHPEPWCATTENYDRDHQWKYCGKEERPREINNSISCEIDASMEHQVMNSANSSSRVKDTVTLTHAKMEQSVKLGELGFIAFVILVSMGNIARKTDNSSNVAIICLYSSANFLSLLDLGKDTLSIMYAPKFYSPNKFSGPLCDIDHSHTCYSGNGHLYRGMAHFTFLEEPCLPWDSPTLFHEFSSNTLEDALSLGLGEHAFCRNPDNDIQPWCYVLREKQLSWGFCNVPRCHANDSETTMNEEKHVEPVTESPDRTSSTQSSAGSALVCGQRYTKTASRSRVVGGMVAHSDAHPYMAAMPDVSQISVVLGQTLYNVTTKGSIRFQVRGYQLHENYSQINKHHDIALVQLKESAPGHCAEFLHSISPVCLPSSMEVYEEGNQCQVAGWGHQYEGADKPSLYLQEADVPIIPHEQCQSHNVHGTRVKPEMMCAGYMDGRSDACQGDSGGPLVCEERNKATLRGIVSWGIGCAQENKPGVYTNVAHYLDWIQSKMH
uniref:Uncharacterized protein n=1 Tax=Sphaerodactylus townsendi TaxID=933632 RepID=A0ACB8EIM7_9SAUR